ncbi:MAG: DUF177 domain-containing protein [Alphaproteobacteria bacterium]|nr:DUF177 domain-containing protein [Alphaproteobacteria bacterium]MCL2504916.1 DUF177 domain-containing protein [Alphaproteobacteria bacterium]
MTEQNLQNEFSRIITVSRIHSKGAEEKIEASPHEREALAKRFSLIGINSLTAKISLEPKEYFNKQIIAVDGRVNASVRQQCIRTLEEVTNVLDFTFSVIFVKDGEFTGDELSEIESSSLMADEEVDIYYKGRIDIGELAAQQLFVHLDQYPRKVG